MPHCSPEYSPAINYYYYYVTGCRRTERKFGSEFGMRKVVPGKLIKKAYILQDWNTRMIREVVVQEIETFRRRTKWPWEFRGPCDN